MTFSQCKTRSSLQFRDYLFYCLWHYRPVACVHAKGEHFEYSLWTENVDFVHICYIQCDLFDCYIFYYEIMPATLANSFLFILQGSALADLRYGGRF